MYAHIPLMLKTLEKKGREMLAEARGKIVALVNVITIANIMGRKTIDNKYSTCQNTQQGFKQIISTLLLYRDLYVQCSLLYESFTKHRFGQFGRCKSDHKLKVVPLKVIGMKNT